MNIFKDIATLIQTEEGKKALPIIAAAVNNIANNPTAINAVAQGESALTQILAAEIGIGQDALKTIATDITTLANETAAAPATPNATAVVAGPPAN